MVEHAAQPAPPRDPDPGGREAAREVDDEAQRRQHEDGAEVGQQPLVLRADDRLVDGPLDQDRDRDREAGEGERERGRARPGGAAPTRAGRGGAGSAGGRDRAGRRVPSAEADAISCSSDIEAMSLRLDTTSNDVIVPPRRWHRKARPFRTPPWRAARPLRKPGSDSRRRSSRSSCGCSISRARSRCRSTSWFPAASRCVSPAATQFVYVEEEEAELAPPPPTTRSPPASRFALSESLKAQIDLAAAREAFRQLVDRARRRAASRPVPSARAGA